MWHYLGDKTSKRPQLRQNIAKLSDMQLVRVDSLVACESYQRVVKYSELMLYWHFCTNSCYTHICSNSSYTHLQQLVFWHIFAATNVTNTCLYDICIYLQLLLWATVLFHISVQTFHKYVFKIICSGGQTGRIVLIDRVLGLHMMDSYVAYSVPRNFSLLCFFIRIRAIGVNGRGGEGGKGAMAPQVLKWLNASLPYFLAMC